MIISRGNGSRYVVVDTETDSVINDCVILEPFRERRDTMMLGHLHELNYGSVDIESLAIEVNRYWADVDDMTETSKGEDDDR